MRRSENVIGVFLVVIVLAAIIGGCIEYARGATVYGKTVFMDDVSVGSWSAMTGITEKNASGGVYTNAIAYTNYYRLSATNLLGRLPVSATMTNIFTGGTNGTNAVQLAWPRYSGISDYVVEQSDDASTWTNWLVAGGANTTNWLDTGTNTWLHTAYTNLYSAISTPSTPWSSGSGTKADTNDTRALDWSGASSVSVPAHTNDANAAVAYSVLTTEVATAEAGLQASITANSSSIVDVDAVLQATRMALSELTLDSMMRWDLDKLPAGDGAYWEFSDLVGVDTNASVNYVYDSDHVQQASFSINVTNGLLGQWKMNDDAASTTVLDASGLGNSGTAQANTSTKATTGKLNGALTQNGSSDYIDFAAAGLDYAFLNAWDTMDISMACWAMADDWTPGSPCGIFTAKDADGSPELMFGVATSTAFNFRIEDDAGNEVHQAPTDNQGWSNGSWHHIAMTWDASADAMRIYFDGAEVYAGTNASFGTVSQFSNAAEWFVLGGRTSDGDPVDYLWDGALDDTRLWTNRLLTAGEIASLYNAGTGTELGVAVGEPMVLIMSNQTFSTAYDTINIGWLQDMSDSPTLGTDIKAYVSFNGAASNEVALTQGTESSLGSGLYYLQGAYTNGSTATNFQCTYWASTNVAAGVYGGYFTIK